MRAPSSSTQRAAYERIKLDNGLKIKTRAPLTPLPQVGGELLWIRTDTTGKVKRKVLSTAAPFLTSPRLRRRVVSSLNGRDVVGDHSPASADAGAAAEASASVRRRRHRQRQASGKGHPTFFQTAYQVQLCRWRRRAIFLEILKMSLRSFRGRYHLNCGSNNNRNGYRGSFVCVAGSL